MLEILGLTYNDLPPVVPVAGTITGNGETIGRGQENAIVLPDPMRLISRQHLKFFLGDGNTYWVRNISSGNPVFVNDAELTSGMESPLQNHDKILVGGYVLQVTYAEKGQEKTPQTQPAQPASQAQPAAPSPMSNDLGGDDFLAELLGPAAARVRVETPGPGAHLPDPFQYGVTTSEPGDIVQTLNERGVDPNSLEGRDDGLINGEDASAMMNELLQDPLNTSANRQLRQGSNLDPMAMFDENRDNEAFGDILQAGKGTASNVPSSVNLTHGSELDALFQLPSAGNTSAPPAVKPAPGMEPRLQAPQGADIAPGGMGLVHGSELDALFGLSDAGEKPPPVASPAPSIPPAVDFVPSAVDFMSDVEPQDAGVRPIEKAPDIADFDDLDDLITGLGNPGNEPGPTPPRAAQPVVDPLSVFFPDAQSANPVVAPPPAPNVPVRPIATPEASGAPAAPVAARPAARSPAGPSASPADMEGLYQAFIEGLGMELPGRAALDKAFMNMLGQVVRNYTQGTVALIAGRTVVKQAVRANVTVIAPERNNPLKFSPDGNTALQSMFGRPLPGFMGPVEAIGSAFVDLRAHQIGIISGMQAALNHVLDRFDPAMLGDRIPPRGLFENVFSVSHKARLWKEYGQYFHALREKASDHFHEFFGEAFVEAYEKAILTVQSGERTGKS